MIDRTILPLQRSAQAPAITSAEFLARWLEERGLSSEWGTFDPLVASAFLGSAAYPAFKIVTYDEQGIPRPEWSNTRRNIPPDAPLDHNGEPPPKYKFPAGTVSLYANAPDAWRKWGDAQEKWLAEGEGKALALHGAGKAVIGFPGIQNWHTKGEKTLRPQLAKRICQGDKIFVAVDGDWRTNPNVKRGTIELLAALEVCGADAVLVDIPDIPGCAKPGMDDWLAYARRSGQDVQAALAALPRLTLHDLEIPPIQCSQYADILARPSQQWIVKDVIPRGECTAIVGETSCGKTFYTMDLLLAVARGEKHHFGQKIKQHGLVVHITLEGTGLGNRLQAYKKHHKLDGTLPYVAIETPINLRDPHTTTDLIASIKREAILKELPVVLVAVDTVNRAMAGGDENSSVDMGALMASAEWLKSAFTGAGILLVHHTGKDLGRGARGHSSFSANVGAELNVKSDEATGVRTVTVQKQRDGSTNACFNFNLPVVGLGEDEDGDEITSCVVQPCTAPAVSPEANDLDVYRWVYAWNMRERGGSPVTRTDIKRNLSRIKPKVCKMKVAELMAAFEGAINKGWATPAPVKTGGDTLVLLPPPQAKF